MQFRRVFELEIWDFGVCLGFGAWDLRFRERGLFLKALLLPADVAYFTP